MPKSTLLLYCRYGALYGISGIPVMLVIMTVLVLFYNSLK